ncbi:MFS transporter [Brachybacterium hainanense]|uniref:MFS transporter n=1 Tax=Brachybacterium hainanense TaxID=1541174 RepID=A0ABV6R919_9MICO
MVAAITIVAAFVLSNAPTPLYVGWQRAWGFSSGMLTVVFASYMIGLIGALVPAGRLADRYGRRAVLVPSMAAALVSGVLFLCAGSVIWLVAARLLAGAAVAGAMTAGMAAVIDAAPEGRVRHAGLVASMSMVLGAGLGPLLSGVFAQSSVAPQRAVFAIVTGLAFVALAVSIGLPSAAPAPAAAGSDGPLLRWPRTPRDRRRELWWGAATFGPGITATSFVLALGPSVLAGPLAHASALLAGIIACTMFLVATGVQLLAATASVRALLALSSLAALASMAVLALSLSLLPSWQLFAAAALMAGAAQGLGQLAGLTLIATRIAPERRAESTAALTVAVYLPAGIVPVMAGYLADAIGMRAAALTVASLLGVVALVALPSVRRSLDRGMVQDATEAQGDGRPSGSRATLVLIAHPELDRSRVNAAWRRALLDQGNVTVRSLAEVRGPDGFDAALEQRELARHDRIILQFPLHWYSAPALLAEWLEVTFARGWAYGPGGESLRGKELAIAVSTWSRGADYAPGGRYGRSMAELTSPFATTAARVGMRYRPGHFLHGVGDLDDAQLDAASRTYALWVTS